MRLVLCDDNRILCEALAVVLEARGHQVLATATESTAGIAEVERHRPDACLLDFRFPQPPDGLGAGLADPGVLAEAARLGVAGVLRKDQNVDHIVGALDVIASGGVLSRPVKAAATPPRGRHRYHPIRDLTSREKEVLRRIVAGQSTTQMTREMGVAASTLRAYVKSILTKLGAHTRLEAAVLATRENLLGDQTA
jgi:two-component system nitrate/nitrite response regulator NarL